MYTFIWIFYIHHIQNLDMGLGVKSPPLHIHSYDNVMRIMRYTGLRDKNKNGVFSAVVYDGVSQMHFLLQAENTITEIWDRTQRK